MSRWILVNREHNCTMYAMCGSAASGMRPDVTDNIDEATVFDENDNKRIKERFYSAVIGVEFKAEDLP